MLSGLLIVVLIISLHGLGLMLGTLIDVADIVRDELDEAKNLTFPANETRRNSVMVDFTFAFSGTGMIILLLTGLLVLVFLSLPYNLRAAWDAYKRRPTLEERVETLEKGMGK